MVQITNAGDLRTAYLQTFDSFALTPGDIVESSEGRVNMRYARELLGVLVQAELLTVTDVNGEGDVWQVANPGTYDTAVREEAESVIDAWLDNQTPTEKASKPKSTKSKDTKMTKTPEAKPHPCYCGCKENVPAKSFYRPGHDARHAGVIGRKIAENYNVKDFDRRELLNDLPSDRLVAKAEGIAEKAIEKTEAKTAKAEAKANAPKGKLKAYVEGTAKRGKTEVIARRAGDDFEYLDDKGDWRPLSKAAQKTFVEE